MKHLFSLNSPYSPKLKLFILYFTIIYPSLFTNYVTHISTGAHPKHTTSCLLFTTEYENHRQILALKPIQIWF